MNPMEEKRKGFLELSNLIKSYKRKVTYTEILTKVCNEGWYNDFKRISQYTVKRAIERNNEKYN